MLAGCLTIPFLESVNPDSVLKDFFTPQVLFISLCANFLLFGFVLFITIAMARTTEGDLRSFSLVDENVGRSFVLLQPDKRSIWSASIVSLIILWLYS